MIALPVPLLRQVHSGSGPVDDGKRLDALDVVFGAKAIFIREGV